MFHSMRNQLREKTGKDVPKFTPQKGNLARSSRQGSESSLGSLVLDSSTQQSAGANSNTSPSPTSDLHQIKLSDGKVLSQKEVNSIAKKEDEWRSRLEKKDADWTKKYEKRESELLKQLSDKEQDWRTKEHSLTEELLKQTNELKDALKIAEDCKRKIIEFQEEKDQVESFQTQEMSKIKHLLLAKERENTDISASLKENTSLVESLKAEVSRLRPFEEKITDIEDEMESLRHSSEKERQSLSRKLTERDEEVRHLTDKVELLAKRSSQTDLGLDQTPDSRIQALLGERTLLERRLEETHIHLTDIKASWSAQISSLETQVGRLSRQAGEEGVERRRAEQKVAELSNQLQSSESEIEKLKKSLEQVKQEKEELASTIDQLNSTVETLNKDKESCSGEIEVLKKDKEELKKKEEEWESKSRNQEEEIKCLKEELKQSKWQMDEMTRSHEDLVLRNAQLSQDKDMALGESIQLKGELETALTRASSLQEELKQTNQECSRLKTECVELTRQVGHLQVLVEESRESVEREKHLSTAVADLETQLTDRNKTIRVLQQNLNDMKRTLQKELKQNSSIQYSESDSNHMVNSGPATLPVQTVSHPASGQLSLHSDGDINHQYLKHVIVKFLTSREYEAQQLTKAVSTLLRLSPEEELLIKDTLDWKMSWFGSRPRLQDYS